MAQKARQRDETKLIEDLARGTAVTEAARRSGLGRRTVHRRLEEPEFRARVARARRDMIQGATEGLAGAAESAVETLTRLLEAESDSVKLGAARAILDGVLRFREAEVLAERVRKLEGRQDPVRSYLANLTGEEVEAFYFELRAPGQPRAGAVRGRSGGRAGLAPGRARVTVGGPAFTCRSPCRAL